MSLGSSGRNLLKNIEDFAQLLKIIFFKTWKQNLHVFWVNLETCEKKTYMQIWKRSTCIFFGSRFSPALRPRLLCFLKHVWSRVVKRVRGWWEWKDDDCCLSGTPRVKCEKHVAGLVTMKHPWGRTCNGRLHRLPSQDSRHGTTRQTRALHLSQSLNWKPTREALEQAQ